MSEIKKDDAYGMVRVSRVMGSDRSLFGSSIEHRNTVQIEISNGRLERDVSSDFYHETTKLLTIELSPTQFADMITCIGSAVPCTITWEKGKGMIPYPDFISKREQFRGEFNDYIDQSANDTMGLIHTCEELFKKKNLSKSDKSEVLSILNKISMSISGNLKFVAKTFDEQMERTTVEAKNEIEAILAA